MRYAATPLGMGVGLTRFASPNGDFTVLYLARDLTTSIAETLVRDRFQNRSKRRLLEAEAALWGVTIVDASSALTLLDLRTTGLVRLGVSTDAARGKYQTQGRRLSEAVYEQTYADGFFYLSRLTGGNCLCIFDRSLPSLMASPVIELSRVAGFVQALKTLNVTVVATD